jgi:hypothetical protein
MDTNDLQVEDFMSDKDPLPHFETPLFKQPSPPREYLPIEQFEHRPININEVKVTHHIVYNSLTAHLKLNKSILAALAQFLGTKELLQVLVISRQTLSTLEAMESVWQVAVNHKSGLLLVRANNLRLIDLKYREAYHQLALIRKQCFQQQEANLTRWLWFATVMLTVF